MHKGCLLVGTRELFRSLNLSESLKFGAKMRLQFENMKRSSREQVIRYEDIAIVQHILSHILYKMLKKFIS